VEQAIRSGAVTLRHFSGGVVEFPMIVCHGRLRLDMLLGELSELTNGSGQNLQTDFEFVINLLPSVVESVEPQA